MIKHLQDVVFNSIIFTCTIIGIPYGALAKSTACTRSCTQPLLVNLSYFKNSSVTTLDTVACIFREVVPNHHPAVLWKSGFIVLQNSQLIVNHVMYPVADAATLSGSIQNRFLQPDRKTLIKKKVIQVVLLN